ncbi:hypothetical protein E1258_27715, partial [Micromonospora sp. KC207]|uniref:hypothetical protein n=1 Tax=Micromonospora sp. KC207 TaxID=2530377 RepID=UPI0010E4AA79
MSEGPPGGMVVDEALLERRDAPGVVILSGGNAVLDWHRHRGHDQLYKRFRPEHRDLIDEGALLRLIRWRWELPAPDRDRLDQLAAWPRYAVRAGGRLTGVLVPPAADRFFTRRRDGRLTPRPLHGLLGAAGRPGAPTAVRLAVLGRLIRAVRWLHGRDVVVNDLQPENVLYTLDGPGPAVHLVDCDSMTSERHWGRVAPVTAPDLMAEVVPANVEPTVATDLTKLMAVVALTARETLTYAARLRSAPDTSAREVADRVGDVLGRLGLDQP